MVKAKKKVEVKPIEEKKADWLSVGSEEAALAALKAYVRYRQENIDDWDDMVESVVEDTNNVLKTFSPTKGNYVFKASHFSQRLLDLANEIDGSDGLG